MANKISLVGERQKQAAKECNIYLDECGHKDMLCMAYFEGWQRADQTNTNLPEVAVVHILQSAVKDVLNGMFDMQLDSTAIAERVAERYKQYSKPQDYSTPQY